MPSERSDRPGSRGVDAPQEPAWHERTGTLAGASIAALVVIALLYFLISTVARQFDEPDPAPGYYPDSGGTSTSSYRTSYGPSSTTSEIITSTVAPTTSDINPGDTTTSSSTDPSSTATTTEPSQLIPPSTRDRDETSRSRPPRFNQTRTVYPPP